MRGKHRLNFFGDVMSRDCFLHILWMMHVGEMIPLNKAIGTSKGQECTWGDRTHPETVSEKFCAR
jgi:hypothetical protein